MLPNRSGPFINGRYTISTQHRELVNPATEERICTFPVSSESQVGEACAAAHAAFPSWSVTTGVQRATFLRAIAAEITRRKEQLAYLDTLGGKTSADALADIADCSGTFEYFAVLAERLDKQPLKEVEQDAEAPFRGWLKKEPIGPVALITPWNYPLLMSAWKLAPALAAGCTLVIKPSELAPLSTLEFGDICNAVGLPRGVVNVVVGDGLVGSVLSKDPRMRKVSFTGSGPTGAKIMHAAADNMAAVTLELGGKSPLIIFPGSPDFLEKALEWVMFGIFANAGQVCSATSRVLIHQSVATPFLARLKEETERLKVGDPTDPSTAMGPLISKSQWQRVCAMVDRAKESSNATLLTGGSPLKVNGRGYYFQPTVFVEPDVSSEVWRDEVFGPVLSVRSFKTEEEAVFLANDTELGLAAAVFSPDPKQLERVALAMRAGVVWKNCAQPVLVEAPWGGYKKSGIGRDLGEEGLAAFMETKTIVQMSEKATPFVRGLYFKLRGKL